MDGDTLVSPENAESSVKDDPVLAVYSVKIVKSIGKIFEHRRKAPNTVFDIVYTRSQWNHFELAELLQLEPEYIKHLLKALGYVYDRKKMTYVQSEYIDDIHDKLNKIPPINC